MTLNRTHKTQEDSLTGAWHSHIRGLKPCTPGFDRGLTARLRRSGHVRVHVAVDRARHVHRLEIRSTALCGSSTNTATPSDRCCCVRRSDSHGRHCRDHCRAHQLIDDPRHTAKHEKNATTDGDVFSSIAFRGRATCCHGCPHGRGALGPSSTESRWGRTKSTLCWRLGLGSKPRRGCSKPTLRRRRRSETTLRRRRTETTLRRRSRTETTLRRRRTEAALHRRRTETALRRRRTEAALRWRGRSKSALSRRSEPALCRRCTKAPLRLSSGGWLLGRSMAKIAAWRSRGSRRGDRTQHGRLEREILLLSRGCRSARCRRGSGGRYGRPGCGRTSGSRRRPGSTRLRKARHHHRAFELRTRRLGLERGRAGNALSCRVGVRFAAIRTEDGHWRLPGELCPLCWIETPLGARSRDETTRQLSPTEASNHPRERLPVSLDRCGSPA